jgi:hypothetical protein
MYYPIIRSYMIRDTVSVFIRQLEIKNVRKFLNNPLKIIGDFQNSNHRQKNSGREPQFVFLPSYEQPRWNCTINAGSVRSIVDAATANRQQPPVLARCNKCEVKALGHLALWSGSHLCDQCVLRGQSTGISPSSLKPKTWSSMAMSSPSDMVPIFHLS